jgi:gliding motility-associated-like protein
MYDENGCFTNDQIRIFVENDIDIFIPNAFAPTGSGNNDKLIIYAGKGVERIERFQIFDRWGNQVFGEGSFQPNDPSYGWDGRLNGQIMNAAVFVYYVEVLLTNGKTVVLKGDVMLMR